MWVSRPRTCSDRRSPRQVNRGRETFGPRGVARSGDRPQRSGGTWLLFQCVNVACGAADEGFHRGGVVGCPQLAAEHCCVFQFPSTLRPVSYCVTGQLPSLAGQYLSGFCRNVCRCCWLLKYSVLPRYVVLNSGRPETSDRVSLTAGRQSPPNAGFTIGTFGRVAVRVGAGVGGTACVAETGRVGAGLNPLDPTTLVSGCCTRECWARTPFSFGISFSSVW